MLKHSLEQSNTPPPPSSLPIAPANGKVPSTPNHDPPILPINVRAFLQQYSVPQEAISKVFIIEGDSVAPTFNIFTTKKSDAQIQVALLTALGNAISKQGNKFEFSMEAVRQQCQTRALYDQPNFAAHFKNNVRLFKSLIDKDHVELSPEGLTELAAVIQAVAK